MKRFWTTTALTLALLAPASARADGTKAFDFCGGSYSGYTGFAFCASVVVSVAPSTHDPHALGAYTVTMDIANLSGAAGVSYPGTVFTRIGLDNIDNSLAIPANLTISQNGST